MAVSGKMPNSPTFEATILQTINCLIIFSSFFFGKCLAQAIKFKLFLCIRFFIAKQHHILNLYFKSKVINSIGQILLSDRKYYQSLIQNDFLPKFIDAVGIIFIESLQISSANSDFNLYQSISKFLSILSLYKPEKLLQLIKSLEKDIFK